MKQFIKRSMQVGVLLGLTHAHAMADEFVWHKISTSTVGNGGTTGVTNYAIMETMLRDEAVKICGSGPDVFILLRGLQFNSLGGSPHGSFNLVVSGCAEGSASCNASEQTAVTWWGMYPPFSASAEISCRVRMK
ncbi:MAG: hypothetical protein NTV34_15835 [Proteobacteria bacterium]|nr:hypothetical protein [Pseudomonadota bacterium]